MSDRPWTDTRGGGDELDFSGLLPGDDQPRRRRRRPQAREAVYEETGPGSDEKLGEPTEEAGTPQDVPSQPHEEEVEGATTTTSPTEEVDGTTDADTRPTAPADSTGELADGGVGPSRWQADGSAASARGATEHGEPRPELPTPEERIADAGNGPEVDQNAPASGPTRRLARTSDSAALGAGAPIGRTDPEAQAALVEGDDLDCALVRVAALTPEERGEYKSTLLLSEEHYELLMDLRKEFRRRGFKGRDATISNVISVGLEVMRHTLDAEKILPSR